MMARDDDNPGMHETTFGFLTPTAKQRVVMDGVRQAFAELLHVVEENVPSGRYRSLSVTALEQASMWAMKGITRLGDGTPREDEE
jgi:hypothetical protein